VNVVQTPTGLPLILSSLDVFNPKKPVPSQRMRANSQSHPQQLSPSLSSIFATAFSSAMSNLFLRLI
jgi:hypothetical protein